MDCASEADTVGSGNCAWIAPLKEGRRMPGGVRPPAGRGVGCGRGRDAVRQRQNKYGD